MDCRTAAVSLTNIANKQQVLDAFHVVHGVGRSCGRLSTKCNVLVGGRGWPLMTESARVLVVPAQCWRRC